MVGITAYGAYIPKRRLNRMAIHSKHGLARTRPDDSGPG